MVCHSEPSLSIGQSNPKLLPLLLLCFSLVEGRSLPSFCRGLVLSSSPSSLFAFCGGPELSAILSSVHCVPRFIIVRGTWRTRFLRFLYHCRKMGASFFTVTILFVVEKICFSGDVFSFYLSFSRSLAGMGIEGF